jgi:hypothetical protein
MATYTCSIFEGQAVTGKALQAGDFTVQGGINFPAASSVGDTVFACKVPHGATIVDFWEYHTTGATAQTIQWGLSKGVAAGGGGALSCLTAAVAQAATNRFSFAAWKAVAGNVCPPTVSVSDTDTVRYATLVGTVAAGSATTSLKVYFSLTYRMDGPYPQGVG